MATAFTTAIMAKDRRSELATEFIDSVVTPAHQIRQRLEPEWNEQWQNYFVEPYYQANLATKVYDPYYTGINRNTVMELKTPESHQIANTLTAVLMGSLFGTRDYVQTSPVGGEDVDAASKLSRLVMWGLERPGGYRTDVEELKDGVIFGLGCSKVGWQTRMRSVPRRLPVPGPDGLPITDPETGLPITILQNVTLPVYDDVARYPVSLFDVWFDPAATRLADCNGVVERGRMSSDTLASFAGQPGWVRENVAQVLAMKPQEWAMGPGEDTSPKLTILGLTRDDLKHIQAFGYRGSWTYTGMIPTEVAKQLGLNPLSSNVLVIVNGLLVYANQSSQRNAELPYTTTTILPTGGHMYGLSPLRVIRYLQDVSDTQLILTVQAALEAVYQNYIVGGAAAVGPGFVKELERRKPRQVFSVAGDVTQIVPLEKDYTGLQVAIGMLTQLSAQMRDASNARDPVQGIQSNDRSTATEVSTVAQAALQNVDQLAMLIERDELPRKGRLVADEYYINLDDEGKFIKRVGDDQAAKISFSDIDMDYDINFVGARLSLTKAAKANAMRDFATMMLSNPLTAASFDALTFAQMYADQAVDVRGLEKTIITDQAEVLARLQASGIKGPLEQPSATDVSMQAAQSAGGSDEG